MFPVWDYWEQSFNSLEWEDREGLGEGHGETFGDTGHVHYIDYGGGFLGGHVDQNLSNHRI